MAKDRKLVIAVLIILVLLIALAYVLIIGPGISGYIVKKQVNAQQAVVDTVIDIVNQQGYIVLNSGNESIVLVKYTGENTPTAK